MKQLGLLCVLLGSLAGCEEAEQVCTTCAGLSAIEVAGTWESNFASEEVITDASWAFMEIVSYDNGANEAVTQNPADDAYNPDKFNRLVWTELDGDTFHYCVVAFGKDTAEAAAADPAEADASDPEAGGCGGFAWTTLTRQ